MNRGNFLRFVTWRVMLLEAVLRRWVHRGHNSLINSMTASQHTEQQDNAKQSPGCSALSANSRQTDERWRQTYPHLSGLRLLYIERHLRLLLFLLCKLPKFDFNFHFDFTQIGKNLIILFKNSYTLDVFIHVLLWSMCQFTQLSQTSSSIIFIAHFDSFMAKVRLKRQDHGCYASFAAKCN